MKKILTVFTGGTICTASDGKCRSLSPDIAKRALFARFAESESAYAGLSTELFFDSGITEEQSTLSENMTLERLDFILKHINSFSLDEFSGVILLHGTDTLAFSAAILYSALSTVNVPVMLVSGNRPPMDDKSNAVDNFRAAVELILGGIAPSVYVPYANSDGKTYLHIGDNIMQCANFSEDFFGAHRERSFELTGDNEAVIDACRALSEGRAKTRFEGSLCDRNILVITPYTNLDYSRFLLDGVDAVLHGAYHSGTVCVAPDKYSRYSVLWLAERCSERGIPLFIAPSALGAEQYASVFDMVEQSSVTLLDMPLEAAYGRLLVGSL